ncbi:hypothetical protein APSETT445_003531 [Aspergillus pseudonomiae]
MHTVSGTNSLTGSRSSLTSSHQLRDGHPGLTRSLSGDWLASASLSSRKRRVRPLSYRTHFKQKYMVESAWNKGGRCTQRHITPDQGVVTSLHLTPKYIVVALDNAKIHIYDTNGDNQKTLQGHVMGVWAMVPWDDILVSGGCDRDVRVWNMATGDTTLRIWDLASGTCRNVLVGHQASVRCLAIHGDLVVSGSYDTTARIWSISEGRCLRTLSGHFSQIYAIAFDGRRIATGSLDTSVRIWDPQSGQCHAILQGHTSLVGQLQMRGDTLVTGGSDGSVRVWSLTRMTPIHRLAAHDNSVTSLQFDSSRIVSGGSDGRVKVWSLQTGQLLRELSSPAEAVWRVAFEEEKAVIMASRSGRTVMELATEAAALITLSNHMKAPPLLLKARGYYGLALHGLRRLLGTRSQAVKDETFATMVILSIFEDIAGERNGLYSSHTKGFGLLMAMRGESQLSHAQGRDLFICAYAHTGSLDIDNITQLTTWIETGNSLALEMANWSQHLPDHWLPLVVSTATGGSLMTYQNASIAAIWTYYRAARISLQRHLLDLRRNLASLVGDNQASDVHCHAALEEIQEMTSDTCRSIPFSLGDVDAFGQSIPTSTEGRPPIRALYGYLMLWPLWYVQTFGMCTVAQMEQIRSALGSVGSVLGIKLAFILAQQGSMSQYATALTPNPYRFLPSTG